MDFSGENPFGEALKRQWLTDLENSTDFWNHTPQLQQIAYTAAKKRVGAWGLLLMVQQHQASHVDATHVLVDVDGMPGATLAEGTALSGYVGLVADTGGGKNVVFRTATSLVKPATSPIAGGTGQGIIKSFADTQKVTEADKVARYKLVFQQHVTVIHCDEIDSLNAEFARDASSTDATLRSVWTGGVVGNFTGDVNRRVTIPANMYRLHGIWCVQPTRAGEIMSRAEGGTPQRWVWAPAFESRVRAMAPKRTAPPANVTFPLPVWNTGTNQFGTSGGQLPSVWSDGEPVPAPRWITWNSSPKLQQWYADAIAEREKLLDHEPFEPPTPEEESKRQQAAMSSHTILTTIKTAVHMAWLHGRREPTDLDFELALVQMEVSRACVAGVWQRLAYAQSGETTTKGKQRGEEMHAADIARDNAMCSETQQLADSLWTKLATDGPRSIAALRGGLSHRRKKLAKDAREFLEDNGRVGLDRFNQLWAFGPTGAPVAPKGFTYEPPV
ncbi:hypothetical protein F0402_15810 [Mycolicibacter arupensis]|jgi:hypothetical protein|nr:hypothetical protein F0402_15810 [Mycolicibacter arupensis]